MQRILRAAARQGAASGLERVQMHEVAKESGVAIATLYRYFPSKMLLFTAVMQSQIDRIRDLAPPPSADNDPVGAVTDLLLEATRQMLGSPLLAHAMMLSNNAALHATEAEAGQTTASFTQLLLRTAQREAPSARDHQLARLVEQAWYGVLTSALNQHTSHDQVEDDLRVTCQLLLAEWSTT